MATEKRANRGPQSQQEERKQGLAYAAAWRERMRPVFDAMYGEDRCRLCGAAHRT